MTPIVVVGLEFQASDTQDVELVGPAPRAEQGETSRSSARIARTINFTASRYHGEIRPAKRKKPGGSVRFTRTSPGPVALLMTTLQWARSEDDSMLNQRFEGVV